MLFQSIVFCLFGLFLVVFGSNWLIDGASNIARKFSVSEFLIGFTIVGFGTSLPELVVSTIGALNGSPDIAIGNVIGSNVFNSTLILGLASILAPIGISTHNKKVDIPLTIGVTLVFILFGLTKMMISRIEAIIFILLFMGYLFWSFKAEKKDNEISENNVEETHITLFKPLFLTIVGLAGLIFGGKLFVDSSVEIARIAGMSEKFIGLTILSAGTSLPELVTCTIAAIKGKGQMALGDILGSNIFNILLILGVGGSILPLSFAHISIVDISALLFGVIMIFISSLQKDTRINWNEGCVMLLGYLMYFGWLIFNL